MIAGITHDNDRAAGRVTGFLRELAKHGIKPGDVQVIEVDFPRAGQAHLGEARARADGSCSFDTLRAALRAAAARVGATSVVDVRCSTTDGEPFCIASLAGSEVIEPAVAEVR